MGVPVESFPFKTEIKYGCSLRSKLGVIFNENHSMLYLTGGFAAVKIKRYHEPNPDFSISNSWKAGWAAGLGFEKLISDNISLKIEYRYANYGKEEISSIGGENTHYNLRFDENTLRAGIEYNF